MNGPIDGGLPGGGVAASSPMGDRSPTRRLRPGRSLLALSLTTRVLVLAMLCVFALWTEYSNLKQGYNNPRLVELSSGKTMRVFYEATDTFLGWFGDPAEVARINGGMTWSIRVMGVPFTDPVAALSLLAKDHRWPLGFALGLIIPVGLALVFGRVFCNYICPASLMFYTIHRVRRLLARYFYFPEAPPMRFMAVGVLLGGLTVAVLYGHGVWVFLLPYFGIGQTLFHAIAFGTLSVAVAGVLFFAGLDLVLGDRFFCRNLCPTGRVLGWVGRRAPITVRREATLCIDTCHSCTVICPLGVDPKRDQTIDCSLCGECLAVCPSSCLSIGRSA